MNAEDQGKTCGDNRSATERDQEWVRLMQTVQGLPQAKTISDADIAAEIDAVRQRSLLSCG